MKRRDFVRNITAGAVVGGGLAGCNQAQETTATGDCVRKTYKWKVVTAWPKNAPGPGIGIEKFAKLVGELSNGELTVKVYSAGEIVPALEVFDAVREGVAEMGHASAYYWQGKGAAFPFFSTIPFGMNTNEMNAWLYDAGGLQLWEELYRPFGLMPLPMGNTGKQMGGWYNKEINRVEDFQGLKMRIPGLGGAVLERLGVVPVNIPGGELFTAIQTGTLDAAEWATPYNDLAFGLYKVAKYYYYPGWQEPGSVLEGIINIKAFNELPKHLQDIVRAAARVTNSTVYMEYLSKNQDALDILVNKHGVQLRKLSDEILATLKKTSETVIRESVVGDPLAMKVHKAYTDFHSKMVAWRGLSLPGRF